MNTEKIIEFVKVNGGATVALFLSFIYISKLETRLERVEQQLHDCYTRTYASTDFVDFETLDLNRLFAVLPKETKIEKDEKKKVS